MSWASCGTTSTRFANDEVQVLTISIDSSFSHKIFAQRDGLNFPLLADFWPHGGVAQAYGVFNSDVGVANRGTFLVDPGRHHPVQRGERDRGRPGAAGLAGRDRPAGAAGRLS